MNNEPSAKFESHSFRPHNTGHCKPCPKPQSRNCLIRFTPLQADLFEELLDNLIDSIQPAFLPPTGPLPAVFKVLQNLFKSMRLSLRDQAALFAATELPITAYEQSDEWTPALIAATQSALNELYALSLLACVSSAVKDGWVIRIRTAEANLAGIESIIPPVIGGSTIAFNGESETISMSFSAATQLPTTGVVIGSGFVSQSLPVATNSAANNVSITLVSSAGGSNDAFSMPESGTLVSMSAGFYPNDLTITGGAISIQAQLCRALPGDSPYTPFVAIPGAVFQMLPSLSGNVSGLVCAGSLTGLDIPIHAEDRLVLVYTASALGHADTTPTTITGTGGASITLGLAEAPAADVPILLYASSSTIEVDFNSSGDPTSAGAVAFGFSQTVNVLLAQPFSVNPEFNQFTTTIPGGGTITSVAAYFGVESNQVIIAGDTINIQVLLYRYTDDNLTANSFGNIIIRLTPLTEGTYTETSPGAHGIVSGLNIPIGEEDRILLVFSGFADNAGGTNRITGWASGGISIVPNSSTMLNASQSINNEINLLEPVSDEEMAEFLLIIPKHEALGNHYS
ncbi:hypothetical protein M3223_21395 [Paenibacillus pasadenensis]|uniref:hypothetical protein n=1 Tax=Paenibacillus pasadenensis TaxID=217090 RepID=UPI00203C4D24|nr:hypothetical protein [Paenibacillus pasadenensis]MCM3749893.1 hypothetical protein [Paenibacillus pasadenensis]